MIKTYLNTVHLSSMQSFIVNVKHYPASVSAQLRGPEASLGIGVSGLGFPSNFVEAKGPLAHVPM